MPIRSLAGRGVEGMRLPRILRQIALFFFSYMLSLRAHSSTAASLVAFSAIIHYDQAPRVTPH